MVSNDEKTDDLGAELTKKRTLRQKLADFMRAQLANANGRIQGRVVGNGPADDVKKARDALPLFLRIFGVLPCFDSTQKARSLHARKVRRAGFRPNGEWYKDVDGVWQPLPQPLKLKGRAKKLGFHGSWRSPSLKPSHALKAERAARIRAKLESPDGAA